MFSYLLSNVYELVSRATLLGLAVFAKAGIFAGLIQDAGDYSDLAVRAILVVLAFLTGKPFAKFSAIVAAGGFAYMFTDEAIALGSKAIELAGSLL